MERLVIHVHEEACIACGNCLSSCPRGAIELVMDRAVLVDEALCAGDGACLEACGGALELELREAAPYDEAAVERRRGKRELLRSLGAEI